MKFLVPNYSCLQNPWLGGYRPPDPRSLCPLSSTEFVETPSRTKFLDTPLLNKVTLAQCFLAVLPILRCPANAARSHFICLSVQLCYRSYWQIHPLIALRCRLETLRTVWKWRWASGVPRGVLGAFTRHLCVVRFLWRGILGAFNIYLYAIIFLSMGHAWCLYKISVCHHIPVNGACLMPLQNICSSSYSCEWSMLDAFTKYL